MKEFVFVLCLINVCICTDNIGEKYNEDEKKEVIIQPCSKQDIDCIRSVLSEKLQCSPIHGHRSDRYYRVEDISFHLPHANSTIEWNNAIIEGFKDYTINEFYLNEKTDSLVFEVTLKTVVIVSPKTTFYFYMKGKEPVITEDYITERYNDISLTLTIRHVSNYKKSRSHIYTFLNDPFAAINLGPRLTPEDPVALINYKKILTELPLTLKEAYVIKGPALFSYFLNTVICDLNINNFDNLKHVNLEH